MEISRKKLASPTKPKAKCRKYK